MNARYASVTITPVSRAERKLKAKERKQWALRNKKSKKRLALIKEQKKLAVRSKRADEFRNKLIEKATPAELRLKEELTKIRAFYQFQYTVIGEQKTAIIDFCLPRKNKPKLFIELDGEYHESRLQSNLDKERTEWLLDYTDCEILRFTNKEVLTDTERVMRDIQCRDIWIKSVVGKGEAMA